MHPTSQHTPRGKEVLRLPWRPGSPAERACCGTLAPLGDYS